jgi:cobalt-zinc-cadmium efflux system outer membrane protein
MTTLFLLPALFVSMDVSTPASAAISTPPDPFDERALAAELWSHSPDLILSRQGLIEAEAVRDHSYVLPNPSLAAAWGTIPIGRRNPPGASFGEVPNYMVGVSEMIELGKRGPRQAAAEAGTKVAALTVDDTYRQSFFTLLETLAEQANATARRAVLNRLVGDSAESLRLQRERAKRGDVAALEVDRLEVEHLRLLSAAREAEEAQEIAVGACARILGADCPRFASEDGARRFLFEGHPGVPVDASVDDKQAVSGRPDLLALDAEQTRLRADLVLAGRAKIPDPTASVSYMHDQFEIAGNQANSLVLAVSLPLPVFDRGQVESARAKRRLEATAEAHRVLSATALRALALARQRLAVLQARARSLDEDALPRARSLAEGMDAASRRGGASLIDVLLARRAFEELQLDRLDVAATTFKARLDVRRNAALYPRPPFAATTRGTPVPQSAPPHP